MKKMTIDEFFSSKKIAVRCDTLEKMLRIYEEYKKNYNIDHWDYFKKTYIENCYEQGFNCITSEYILKKENACKILGYKIIDFNDLILWNEYYMLDYNKYYINEKKKVITIVSVYGKKIIIKCDEDDKFDLKIGLGLALSKLYGNKKEYKEMRELFRSKKTRKLDYKKYGLWCLLHYCNYDISNLDKKLNIIYQ